MAKRSTSNSALRSRAAGERETLWPPGFAAWIKVGVFYQKSSRYLAALLRPLDLTVAQFDALANLYVGDGITQQELAEHLLVTKGNVTGLVNRLSDRGLVTRKCHPADRRANAVFLTSRGQALAKQALEVQRRVVDDTIGVLSRADRERLRELMDLVVTQVEAKLADG